MHRGVLGRGISLVDGKYQGVQPQLAPSGRICSGACQLISAVTVVAELGDLAALTIRPS